jgi:hypothetical protein
MIAHVVLLRPRASLTSDERAAIVRGIGELAANIPSIRSLRVGRRVRHGRPGYEQAMRDDYEFALFVEFDDVDGLTSYLAHPAHEALGRHFTQASDGALAYDYQLFETSNLPALL